jgi:hypothetical protein
MRKHPVSAILRLLPSFLWICASVFFLWQVVELLWGDSSGSDNNWLPTLFALVLLALTAFGIRMARKEFKSRTRRVRELERGAHERIVCVAGTAGNPVSAACASRHTAPSSLA